MRCCRAAPSYGEEETSIVAARSGLCGWGGALICNAVGKQTQRWTNGNGSADAGEHKSDGEVAAEETVYRHNNNNCSSSSNSSAEGMRSVHSVLPSHQQAQRRRQSTSGWRSSNRRYSLLRCILCNLKQNQTQLPQQHQHQHQQQYAQQHTKTHDGQLLQVQMQAQRSRQQQQHQQSQPQAIVVAVVVGASIDHQIQQQEPQLSDHLNVKQQRHSTTDGGGVGVVGDGRSSSGRSSRASSSYNCADVGGHKGGSEALL